jgi:hypothetical protein
MSTAKLMFTTPDHRDQQASLNTEYRGHKEAYFEHVRRLGGF